MTVTDEQRRRRLDFFMRMSAEEDDYPPGGIARPPATTAAASWRPEDHPRGKDGRFIEAGAVVDLLKKAVKDITTSDVNKAVGALNKKDWDNLKPAQQKHITDLTSKLPAESEARQKLKSLDAKIDEQKTAPKTPQVSGKPVVPAIIYKKNPDGFVVAESPDGKKRMRWDVGSKKFVVEDENGKQLDSLTKTAAYKAVKDSKRWVAPGQTDATPVQEEPVEADIPEVTSANVDEDIPEVTPSNADEVTLPVVEVPVVEPMPKQVLTPTPGPITGKRLNRPLIQNTWGYTQPGDPVSFHPDGELGNALLMMGDDVFMDVDGEPLGDVIGKLATQAVVGDKKMQQVLDELEQLHQRLPVGSQARNALFDALDRLRAPNTPEPVLPSGTPEPLQQLMSDLHAVPIVRNDPSLEEQPLVKIAQLAAKGASTSRLVNEVRKLANRRHESIEGKPEIDRAVQKAIAALQTGQISTKVESPQPRDAEGKWTDSPSVTDPDMDLPAPKIYSKSAAGPDQWLTSPDVAVRASTLWSDTLGGMEAVRQAARNLRDGHPPLDGVDLDHPHLKRIVERKRGKNPYTRDDLAADIIRSAQWINEEQRRAGATPVLYRGMRLDPAGPGINVGDEVDGHMTSWSDDFTVASRYAAYPHSYNLTGKRDYARANWREVIAIGRGLHGANTGQHALGKVAGQSEYVIRDRFRVTGVEVYDPTVHTDIPFISYTVSFPPLIVTVEPS